jgi:hypothetical protein
VMIEFEPVSIAGQTCAATGSSVRTRRPALLLRRLEAARPHRRSVPEHARVHRRLRALPRPPVSRSASSIRSSARCA